MKKTEEISHGTSRKFESPEFFRFASRPVPPMFVANRPMSTSKRTTLSEPELVQAACRGEESAQRVIFERFRDRVYSLAIYSLGDETMAEDILQSVFIKVFQALPAFRFESELGTWIYRIAINECHDQRRRARMNLVTLDSIIGSDAEIDATPGLDARQLERERAARVQRAILKMSPKLRDVLVLRYVEELSYEEISQVLDLSMGTVASRLNRALVDLERRLKASQVTL